ncbi:ATP-binding protein [Streptomyces sp. NPDC057689]|uniref:ATP-binding protein n=1 Tax=Streptomyces sp. NPDC057689 TaxID=3346213 RepID=UPI0036CE49F7
MPSPPQLPPTRHPACLISGWTSVGASRDFVSGVLTEWRLHTLIEDIRLCVSELATNGLLHGVPPGREFSVVLHRAEDQVRLEVRDSGPGQPRVQQAAEGSRMRDATHRVLRAV